MSIKNNDMSPNEPDPYVYDESLYAHKPTMVWEPPLSKFVLNRLIELAKSDVCFNQGIKGS
jgi:hypothetical protein